MIKDIFAKAKSKNKTVFIPYFPAGFPTMEKSMKVYFELTKNGADIIEVGLPFSDPIADGPTIQEASGSALKSGFKVSRVFDVLKDTKGKISAPVIMTYYNLLYRNGLKNFARKASAAGAQAVIIPDLPVEEAREWLSASRDHLETIFLVAPTSSDERIKKIGQATSGFIYCVSLTGVTGERAKLPTNLTTFLKRVKKITNKPTAVGFGISTKQHVEQIRNLSDGFIVGSAIIKAYSKGKNEKQSIDNLRKLVQRLKG